MSAAARSRWRTGSTRSSARTCGCWRLARAQPRSRAPGAHRGRVPPGRCGKLRPGGWQDASPDSSAFASGSHSEEAADYARVKVERALDRLESELGDDEYLVGDSFSVADLTAAALFYPLVLPPEGPREIADPPPSLGAYRDRFTGRDGFH